MSDVTNFDFDSLDDFDIDGALDDMDFDDEDDSGSESGDSVEDAESDDEDYGGIDSEELDLSDMDFDDDGETSDIDVEDIDIDDDASSYIDGAVVEDDFDTPDRATVYNENGFVSDAGDIVVMETSGEESFEASHVDIGNIAIVHRIRKNSNVDDLARSIKSTGILQPVVVAPTATDGVYVLLDGYRRLLACAKVGKRKIPILINNKVNTPDIPIVEAMYNHSKPYSVAEMVEYIDYLEKQKGIMSASMIEYLLQMNSGDYTKLKDILEDNDDDIVTKLYNGVYNIETAFKKLEQRRKKESAEEKANKRAEKVYGNEEESGASQIAGSGEEADESVELSPEEIANLTLNAEDLDDGLEDASIEDMVAEDKQLPGFEPHKQKTGEREFIDPEIRKAAMARDKTTCQCCKRGGPQYSDILDLHHILPVFLGGVDSVENSIMLCVACHRLVHLYSTGDLYIDSALLEGDWDSLDDEKKAVYQNEQIFEDEKMRFKRIIKLGSVIRKGMAQRGIKREQYKKEHPNTGIGRNLPGKGANKQTKA